MKLTIIDPKSIYRKPPKEKEVLLIEEWKEGWSSPNIWVKQDQRKKATPDNLILLREHTLGEAPFVKYEPNLSKKGLSTGE